MNSLTFRPLARADAEQIVDWRYDGEYAQYNIPPGDRNSPIESMADPSNGYFALLQSGKASVSGLSRSAKTVVFPGGHTTIPRSTSGRACGPTSPVTAVARASSSRRSPSWRRGWATFRFAPQSPLGTSGRSGRPCATDSRPSTNFTGRMACHSQCLCGPPVSVAIRASGCGSTRNRDVNTSAPTRNPVRPRRSRPNHVHTRADDFPPSLTGRRCVGAQRRTKWLAPRRLAFQ